MKPQEKLAQTAEYAKQRAATDPKPPRAYIAQIMKFPRAERPDRIKELPQDVQNTVTEHVNTLQSRADQIAAEIAKLPKLEDRRRQLKHVNPGLVDEVKLTMSKIFKERKNAANI